MIRFKEVGNEKGLTLVELLISIVVGSIVISMLMSVLVMSLSAKAAFDVDNKMLDESYAIVEQIQANLLELGPQEIVIDTTDPNETIIYFRHTYDIGLNEFDVIDQIDLVPPTEDILTYNALTETLTYYSDATGITTLLHSANTNIAAGSSIALISVDPSGLCDFGVTPCDSGVIQLNLNISVTLSGGGFLDPKLFVTTIII